MQDVKHLRVVSGQQLVVLRESADQVGVLLFNSADHDVAPAPEVVLPAGCAAAAAGASFVDLLEADPAAPGGSLAPFVVGRRQLCVFCCPKS